MSAEPLDPTRSRAVRVAIGTHTGVRVSEHFGHATGSRSGSWTDGAHLVESRVNCRPAASARTAPTN